MILNAFLKWIGTPGAILMNIAAFLEFGSLITLVFTTIISILVIIYWIVKIKCNKIEMQLKKDELNNYLLHNLNENEN